MSARKSAQLYLYINIREFSSSLVNNEMNGKTFVILKDRKCGMVTIVIQYYVLLFQDKEFIIIIRINKVLSNTI